MEVVRTIVAFGILTLAVSFAHPGGSYSHGSSGGGSDGHHSSGTSYVAVSRHISGVTPLLVKYSKKSDGGGYDQHGSYGKTETGHSKGHSDYEAHAAVADYGGASSTGGGSKSHSGYYKHREDSKEEKIFDYYAKPQYKFEYKVEDPHTGDIKSQMETRHDDEVKGVYELKEPDGTLLEVHYVADKKNGFNAEVVRKGKAQHPEPSKHYGY